MRKMSTKLQRVLVKTIAAELPQNAVIRMEMPAEATRATTAGRRVSRTLCIAERFRYRRYKNAMRVTMIQDGRIHPVVATIAPGIPAIFSPTNVAELIAIGPGVIWESVMRSVNSVIESQ